LRPLRRSKAGGAKKRPTRYESDLPEGESLSVAFRLQKKGRYAEAAAAYEEALAKQPGSVDAWMNLAATSVMLGSARRAEAAFRRAGELAPNDARVARDRGIGLFAIGLVDEALSGLEASLALDPLLAGARLAAIRALCEAGQRERAIACAEEGVRFHPEQASMFLELHRALYDDRDLERSLPAASRAVELDPAWWLARYALLGARSLALGDDHLATQEGASSSGAVRALRFALTRRASATRFFSSTADVLRHALALAGPGAIVELGVRHGTSTRILATSKREVHAFDSFRGLPEAFYGRDAGAFSTAGEIPDLPDNVRVHVGWFEETLPAWVRGSQSPPALVHVDSDLYSSAKVALEHLGPLLLPGTILVFDEYLTNERWEDDEHRAFEDAAARSGWSREYVAFNLFTGQAVIRIG
jgi:tetratricopeptide (TPR) repeat protein